MSFFFQAEDGIRDYKVTGVQTCALPISGGWARPSCTWQPPQERARKCGPRPSRAVVEAGACTQLRLKKELPMTKRVRSASSRLAAGSEKALRPVADRKSVV